MKGRLVGLNGSGHPARRRVGTASALAAAAVVLSGCSSDVVEQWQRAGLPQPASEETPLVGNLWVGTWIAALGVGLLVWGLIVWSVVVYRKRTDDLPRQTRFNMPIEFFYTVAPFAVVGALFFFTVQNQTDLLDETDDPDLTVGVVGQQWSWTFNYYDEDVYEIGTPTERPVLHLPVGQTVRFELSSPDVIHSFWIPQFYMKMDVIPGRDNSFQLTPNREGSYAGKCAELCGVYHQSMLFDVEVVSPEEFAQRMEELRAEGQTGAIQPPLRASYSQVPESDGSTE